MPWLGWSIPPVESVKLIKNACTTIVKEIYSLEKEGAVDLYQLTMQDIHDLIDELYANRKKL